MKFLDYRKKELFIFRRRRRARTESRPPFFAPSPRSSRNGSYGISVGILDHSGLMPADLITLAHFSVSSAMSLL